MTAATAKYTPFDRAEGALFGLAIGDALGMPSQTLSRADIQARYGRIKDFVAPFDDHPVSHGLTAGQITDDTEQSLLLARRLIADAERFDEREWARDLVAWEDGIRARGLRDLLGPSTKAALDALMAGASPTETGRAGTTNGAAMRIAPVGIATTPEPEWIVARVVATSRVTHHTGEAIAAASAVAMVVSAGIDGADFEDALPHALDAARLGQGWGSSAGIGDMAARIETALDVARTGDLDRLIATTGSSVQSHESVAAAFGLVMLASGDGWQAMLMAANIGDDTDTIGAIAGAMAGACAGASSLPKDAIGRVTSANRLDIPAIARQLLALRHRDMEARQ